MRYTISLVAATLIAATAAAEGPAVVTDIPPVQSLVAQVMGDLGAPVLLLDRGADGHDFQLRPSQMAALGDADLVVWIGPGMSPWLVRALDGSGSAAVRLELLEVDGTLLRARSDVADSGADGDEAADGDSHGDDEDHAHDDGGTDPHAWLDPKNATLWLAVIAAELGRIDPDNAAAYAANAAAAAAAVAAMDARLAADLAAARNRPLVLSHDAYAYFTGHYGLTVLRSISAGDARAPGAARLRQIRDRAGEAACIYPEAGHDPGPALRLAEDTGLPVGPALDPEGAVLDPGPGLYAALMTGLAQGILACFAEPGG